MDAIDRLADALGPSVRRGAATGPLTTYGVGGPAALLVTVRDDEHLAAIATATAAEPTVPTLVVGLGSNLLVADDGFDGLVLVLGPSFTDIDIDGTTVRAGARAKLPVVARQTAAAGLTGFEWASGVPGSIGGAVRMNAGVPDAEISDHLTRVRVVDLASGNDGEVLAADLDLGYRRSVLTSSQVVVWAELELVPGDADTARAAIKEKTQWRRDHQPGGRNAGSVFTNPPGDSAGRLIDAAGCKGLRVGTAEVSPKHANFIQSDEGGTAADIWALMAEVRTRVHAHSGVALHPETHVIGLAPLPALPGEQPWSAFTLRSHDRTAAKPVKATRAEPRLEARRMEVARHQGRKRLRNVLLVLIAIMVVACLWALTRTPVMDVDHVDVSGTSTANADAARAAMGIPLGSSMVWADPGAAEARLEALPWVEQATVARSWPSTIQVRLVERTPVAIMGSGSDAVLVDAHGRTLGPAAGQDLPTIGGDPVEVGEAIAPMRREVAGVVGGLPKDLRAEVATAHASPDGIILTLDDGITVRWGDTSQPTAKAEAVQAILEQAQRATIARIDVTVPRAATVTRNNGAK